MRQARPVRRHSVNAGNGANSNYAFVSAFVAHYADGGNRQQHRESLPDGAIEFGLSQFFVQNPIRGAQNAEALLRDVAKNSYRQTRPGKWMPRKNLFRHSQFPSDQPDFILEELAQRLNQ